MVATPQAVKDVMRERGVFDVTYTTHYKPGSIPAREGLKRSTNRCWCTYETFVGILARAKKLNWVDYVTIDYSACISILDVGEVFTPSRKSIAHGS